MSMNKAHEEGIIGLLFAKFVVQCILIMTLMIFFFTPAMEYITKWVTIIWGR